MKKFKVIVTTKGFLGTMTASTVELEAKDKEEAEEKALKSLYLDSSLAQSFITNIIVKEVIGLGE